MKLVLRLFQWFPLFIACLFCGAIYCLLLLVFHEAIDAETSLDRDGFSVDNGPRLLFAMVSGILGWVSVFVAERATGRAGLILLAVALPISLVTIASGIGVAWIFRQRLPDNVEVLMVACGVFATAASAVRAYWSDLF